MILNFLLVLIALSAVHSAPTSSVPESVVVLASEKSAPSPPSPKIAEEHAIASPTAPEAEHDKKLSRATRANKVEYVYVNSDGEIINRHSVLTKNLVPEKEIEKVVIPKEAVSNNLKRNAESISDEAPKDDSTDALHYSSGSLKLGGQTRRQASALPSATPSGLTQTLNAPPLIPSPTIGQSFYSPIDYLPNSPLLSPYYSPIASPYSYPQSYLPLMQSIYNPYLNAQSYYDPLLFTGQSYYNPLLSPFTGDALSTGLLSRTTPIAAPSLTSSPELDIRRNSRLGGLDWLSSFLSAYPYHVQNRAFAPLSINSLLASNVAYSSPYVNPILSYLLPQQTPSLNYLMGARAGLNSGYNNFGLYPDYLRPLWSALLPQSPMIGAGLYPGGVLGSPFAGIIPHPYQLGGPLYGNQLGGQLTQTLYPQQSGITNRRPETVTTETVTNSNVLPFSDSPASVTPATTSTVLIPGVTAEESLDKPLLYSNQNAALRMPYDNYLNTVYSGRLVDPITGIPYPARYPTSSLYGRYSSYYPSYPYGTSSAYSSYYRPTSLISAPYPNAIYGPYNGVGYIHSPMHYSADASILNKKADQVEAVATGSKPVVPKEQAKDGLMYSIKTSKTESKETVSRLNQSDNLVDDKKD